MEQLTIEDLNCDEIPHPTNDLPLRPEIPAIPPLPPLPDAFFVDNWENLSANEFFVQTRRLNDFVVANQNHPLYFVLSCACEALYYQMKVVRNAVFDPTNGLPDIWAQYAADQLVRSVRLMQIAITISFDASRAFAQMQGWGPL